MTWLNTHILDFLFIYLWADFLEKQVLCLQLWSMPCRNLQPSKNAATAVTFTVVSCAIPPRWTGLLFWERVERLTLFHWVLWALVVLQDENTLVLKYHKTKGCCFLNLSTVISTFFLIIWLGGWWGWHQLDGGILIIQTNTHLHSELILLHSWKRRRRQKTQDSGGETASQNSLL